CLAAASIAPVGFPTKRRRRDELNRSLSPLARESWGSLTTTLSLGNGGGLSADDSVGILLSRLICGERPIGNCNNTALLLVWLVLAPLLFVRDQERARVLVYPRGSRWATSRPGFADSLTRWLLASTFS